jgi:TolB protein
MNADGSDQRRLTKKDKANSWYPSLAPNGRSIVFSSNQTGEHEIYEMDLNGNQTRLTSLGELYAPEISPDGQYIVFTNAQGTYSSIWLINRDGTNPHAIYHPNDSDAVDPTWSPDGNKILFALGQGDNKKLYTINRDGTDLNMVNQSFTTRGRSDWSPDGNTIAGYTGGSWKREIHIMSSNGVGLSDLYTKGNVQAPSFSPDSSWLAFTGYIDKMGDNDGCEIYILRIVDNQLKRLTNNNYCDWQPRWGP